MKRIIKLTEEDITKIVKKVLKEQIPGTTSNELGSPSQVENLKLIQQKLKKLGYNVGSTGPNKDGVDGVYGQLTKQAIKDFQEKNNIKPTGWVGTITAPKLGVSPMKGIKSVESNSGQSLTSTEKGKDTPANYSCIALSQEECKKISPSDSVKISSGSETRCSAYMVKCLSQYNNDLFAGNAWDAFNNVRKKGTVKYNMFLNEMNWDNIYNFLVKNKIGVDACNNCLTDGGDKKSNSCSNVAKLVTASYPNSPKFNIKNLQLGDIVGLYHKNSDNKSFAFCSRIKSRGLDSNGNVKDKDPFTFNSHVGFVGAIKNGIPIIIHNVHGSHLATPATKLMSKNSEDMIVWVVSDNEIQSSVKGGKSPSDSSKKWWDFASN